MVKGFLIFCDAVRRMTREDTATPFTVIRVLGTRFTFGGSRRPKLVREAKHQDHLHCMLTCGYYGKRRQEEDLFSPQIHCNLNKCSNRIKSDKNETKANKHTRNAITY